MCGIYGLVALRDGANCDPSLLESMGAVIAHRGPDDEGFHADRDLAMGMRRLSIIDLDTGHQPISDAAGPIWTVCNGEIYNFSGIRPCLAAARHRLRPRRAPAGLVNHHQSLA